jgi:putative addiction module CopG family antidote
MQVMLTPALDKMVREKVSSGTYGDESEVVRETLRKMMDEDSALDWLRREAALGFEQLDAGEFFELTEDEMMQQLRQRQVR